ncbi:MAG: trimethylamine methyltransferase family protein, partial [Spirochaetales bacterium]|nr:trimethylamine methyltransferase family protein [Spirochaetales bacterium]
MKEYKEPMRILSWNDMETIHNCTLDILENIGMKFYSIEALNYLKKAGCTVDEVSFKVRFPREVVNNAVESMRTAYSNPNRIPEKMAVRYSYIRFKKGPYKVHADFTTSAGGFCPFIYNLENNRRYASFDDVLKSINLVNNLSNINYTGLPVSDQETTSALRPVRMAGELAKYTNKLGGIETFKKEDIKYLIDIGEVISDGEENLKKAPVLVGYAEARSPLSMDNNMTEIFMEYIKRGFPQTVDTMANGGATAPITGAGLLAISVAETLGPLVLGYAIDENATLGVDIIPSYCDMSSGQFRYASAERIPLLNARVQIISEYYGCPSGVHGGKTDSCYPDIQAGIEKAFTMFAPVMAGAIGIGTVGHLENAITFSPLQLVIDNEISGYLHRALKGIEV